MFKKATKESSRLRLAIIGPSGSGKTYTALALATAIGEQVAVGDSERGSASKYAHKFDFDVSELEEFHPQKYIDLIKTAEKLGYDVLVIDGLSQAWAGVGGALELVDKAATRSKSGNKFAAWREVTPLHNKLVDTILQADLHIIATMRAKTEWVVEENDKGKKIPKKIGLAPVQRDGLEYEFDIVADMDLEHNFIISKTRCAELDNAVINRPGDELAEALIEWLGGESAPKKEKKRPQTKKRTTEPPETSDDDTDEDTGKDENVQEEKSDNAVAWWKYPADTCKEVAELINKMKPLFSKSYKDVTDETLEIARSIVCEEFEVGDISDLEEDDVDELREFLSTNIVPKLQDAGYLQEKKTSGRRKERAA